MKISAFVLASLLALPISAFAQAAPKVKLGKITPEIVKTPEFNLSSGPTKRSKNASWLELEVEYETETEEIDELTFKFVVQIEKKLITGEVSYVNIPKGPHFAVMYISPKLLDKLTGGKASTAENAWVSVERQGQVLARGSIKPPPTVPNAPQIPGLLNKNQTPFAPLFFDRYEEIKPR